jgi:hypothetical protein
MVFQLIYTSAATQEFWPDDLFALVEKCRSKNAPRGLTGMLLFHQGQFLQLLEGPESAVRDCFNMVQRDPRHASIEILMTGTRADRDFPGWTMGFEQPGDAWHLPPEWSTILENGFEAGHASRNGSATKDMLLSFRHSHCGA